jgi:ribonuclease E
MGRVKNAELVALEVLRKIQNAVVVGQVALVKARVSPAPALFLLNNKKIELARLEQQYGTQIYVLADGRLRSDEYEFEMNSRREGGAASAIAAPPPPPTRTVRGQAEREAEEDEAREEEEETRPRQLTEQKSKNGTAGDPDDSESDLPETEGADDDLDDRVG